MVILRFLIVAVLPLVFAASLAAQSTCSWNAELVRDWVRSPIQMDIHAGYRIFAFRSDGTVGYRVRAEYPYAAFLSFTVYENALLRSALIDHQIDADPGSTNPFLAGQLVHAPDRWYTVTVLPEPPSGKEPRISFPNPIYMSRATGSNLLTIVLVQRVYLAESKVKDPFGGSAAPTIEPFEVSTGAPAACSTEGFDAGNFDANFGQSPLPRDGKIEFYRPPAMAVPFADGSSPLTKHSCTSYLMATVFPNELALVHLPALPTFFDNNDITKKTVFQEPEVRYLSIGSYGASRLYASDDENVAGPDIKTLSDGSARFIAIPIGLSASDRQQVSQKAAELGYNVMPLAEYGSLIPLDRAGMQINPFLIYRNKVPKEGFVGNILNVACYQGSNFADAGPDYAASPANMGKYAPTGVECSVANFLAGACGQHFSDPLP